jgi:hypothetical protein
MLRDVFAYIFFKPDPAKRMQAKETAKEHVHELLEHIKSHLKAASPIGVGRPAILVVSVSKIMIFFLAGGAL